MSITTETTVEGVMAQIASLSFKEQCQIMEMTARVLKKAGGGGGGKQKRAKKERDPDAPKREPSDWIKHTTHVRQFLPKEHQGVACTQVASMLKTEGKMFPDEDDVMDAYARWKENPPVKADKADKAVAKASKKSSKASSVADEASDAEASKKERKPRTEKTDEQKAALKAKREAKKAAAAAAAAEAESDAESVVPPVAAVEEDAVEGETKEYKIGKKTKMYDCFPDKENKGCEYLYANDTGAFVGRYNTVTKTLDSTVSDPSA
jgi:membrane protein involved in colicin uptake